MFYRVKQLFHYILHRCIGDWNYFLYDQHKKEIMLIDKYYQKNTTCNNSQPLVIFMANGFTDHAGLCDRLKGMTSIYGWCKKNDVDFRIYHTSPFELSEYLVPNTYNWLIEKEDICYNKRWSSVHHAMLNHLVFDQINSGEIVSLQAKWLDKRLCNHKKQHHIYTNFYPVNDAAFSSCFLELFKPSPRLEQLIQYQANNLGNRYISISFRFMQLLGDFMDCDGETLSSEEQKELINRSLAVIEHIKSKHPLVKRVLVTADSPTFLHKAKQLPYVYVIEGKTGHIKFNNSDEVNIKTFLDFFMIAHACKVYLAKSEKMYKSDFARRASMIYGKEFELVQF